MQPDATEAKQQKQQQQSQSQSQLHEHPSSSSDRQPGDPTVIIAVVVLNFNRRRRTIDCVESLLAGSHRPDVVIVVDNGSTEEPALIPSDLAADVVLISLHDNLGYAGGNNAGIRHALTLDVSHVWILNNDTLVESDCLENLWNAALRSYGHQEVYVPAIVNQDDPSTYWYSGGHVDQATGTVYHECSSPPPHSLLRTAYAVGCSILVDRPTLNLVGGFDESLFLYCEDADWTVRARSSGVAVILVSDAIVQHAGGGSTKDGDPRAQGVPFYFKARNRLWLARRGTYFYWGTLVATPRWMVREVRAARAESGSWPLLRSFLQLLRGIGEGLLATVPPPSIDHFERGRQEPPHQSETSTGGLPE